MSAHVEWATARHAADTVEILDPGTVLSDGQEAEEGLYVLAFDTGDSVVAIEGSLNNLGRLARTIADKVHATRSIASVDYPRRMTQ